MAGKTGGKLISGCLLTCPMSGVTIDGQLIRHHTMIATRCKEDKSIFVRCPLHMFTGFLSQPVIIARYLNAENSQAASVGR